MRGPDGESEVGGQLVCLFIEGGGCGVVGCLARSFGYGL